MIESWKEKLIKVAENTKDDKTVFTLVGSDDIWRCGLILVELLSGCLLYEYESFKSYVPVCRVLSDEKVNGVSKCDQTSEEHIPGTSSSGIYENCRRKAEPCCRLIFNCDLQRAKH